MKTIKDEIKLKEINKYGKMSLNEIRKYIELLTWEKNDRYEFYKKFLGD